MAECSSCPHGIFTMAITISIAAWLWKPVEIVTGYCIGTTVIILTTNPIVSFVVNRRSVTSSRAGKFGHNIAQSLLSGESKVNIGCSTEIAAIGSLLRGDCKSALKLGEKAVFSQPSNPSAWAVQAASQFSLGLIEAILLIFRLITFSDRHTYTIKHYSFLCDGIGWRISKAHWKSNSSLFRCLPEW